MKFTSSLLFQPWLRTMPWGGDYLKKLFDQPSSEKKGEAWLLSDHPQHSSVSNLPDNLTKLMRSESEAILGRKEERFPLLVKILDARENLSVQVHPDDELAKKYSPKEGGKTEAWLILHAEPDAKLYLDLKSNFQVADFEAIVRYHRDTKQGKPEYCLKEYSPKAGEVYFVPAGAIHALGSGLVLLEVQQTSDATFRLYDWHRSDRDLHLEQGIPCCKKNLQGCGMWRPIKEGPNCEMLVCCPYFEMRRWSGPAEFSATGASILVGIQGSYEVTGTKQPNFHAVLQPANAEPAKVVLEAGSQVVQMVGF